MSHRFKQPYTPLFFLSALGNGGLSVAFFMYLMFLVKHPKTPIPIFSDVFSVYQSDALVPKIFISLALIAILYFSFRHFQFLVINLREYRKFKQTDAFQTMRRSNSEVNLMTIPLTLAMSVNVLFILGAVFIPGLWSNVELLFPIALLAFALIAVYASYIFGEYISHMIISGDFDLDSNNSLGQLIASFAFIMIAVGFASPGAMSHQVVVSVLGILGAILFGTLSFTLLAIKVVIAMKSILKHGLAVEGAPSLWIAVPIMTLAGITFVRVFSGIHHNLLHSEVNPVVVFIVLAFFVSVQAIAGFIGYLVLKKTQYFDMYLHGDKKHAGSYSLICPGVGAFVLGMFFIHWGFVKTGIVPQFSLVYYLMLAPLVYIQFKTILSLSRINIRLVQ